jgi:hypothetical protein
MRAKTINEDQNFERGKDPKEAIGIGIPIPTKEEISDFILSKELDDPEIEMFVNEIIDSVYREFPRARPEHVVVVIGKIIEEILDDWYQTAATE